MFVVRPQCFGRAEEHPLRPFFHPAMLERSLDSLLAHSQALEALFGVPEGCRGPCEGRCGKDAAVEKKKEEQDDSLAFNLNLNVNSYKPEEIKVKLSDGELTVEGHHKREEDGSVSEKSFRRTLRVPDNADLEKIKSSLSKEGVLKISAPKKVEAVETTEKVLPIQMETEEPKEAADAAETQEKQ